MASADLPAYEAEAAAEQVLYAGLCDALGYSANRAPFRALAARLPLRAAGALVGRAARRRPPGAARSRAAGRCRAATRRSARLARDLDWESAAQAEELERQWRRCARCSATAGGCRPRRRGWRFAGVRPPNAPARRVAALAHLLTWLLPGGLLAELRWPTPRGRPTRPRLRARWQARLRVAAPGGFWAEHSDFGAACPGGRRRPRGST